MERIKHGVRHPLILFLAGALIGAGVLLGIRAWRLSVDYEHYHANFAIFINGQREEFKEPGFYEEVTLCAESGTNPAERAHLHQPNNDVVHVHTNLVTWGHFLENIGYSASTQHLQTTGQAYVTTDTKPLTFILNGEEVRDPSNRLIGNEDRLLISYGASSDETLQEQYEQIENKAAEANHSGDPGTCGSQSRSWRQLLSELF